MEKRKLMMIMGLLMAIAALSLGLAPVFAQDNPIGWGKGNAYGKMRSTTPAQRKAAAANAQATGLQLGAAVAAAPTPGGTPDYFGPYPNYATSPLPVGPVGKIMIANGGSGYSVTPTVTIMDSYGAGRGATAGTVKLSPTGAITAIPIHTRGRGYIAPVVTITDATGTGATAVATVNPVSGTGMRKFVDILTVPPIAQGSTCKSIGYSGTQAADCYEIWLVEYRQQMHSDLPQVTGTWPNQAGGTLMRGYVEVVNGVMQTPSYLGPIIVAQRDKPVRVKFVNKLPTGAGGDLFIPVDTTYMGAGIGPNLGTEMYTQNRSAVHLHGATTPWISDGTLYQWTTPAGETTSYPKGVSVYNVPDMQNSGDNLSAPQGTLTFYYTNQQSARLMFYHDHAAGITRLNVYAGEAAGYLVTDPTEQGLITVGTIPSDPVNWPLGIPLIVQDRTFVPSATQLAAQDPTWNWGSGSTVLAANGSNGDLWFPHVYMTNQNPWDITGANAMGRWDYGPWFWPPFTGLLYGQAANAYCLPTPPRRCNTSGPVGTYDCSAAPWEPPCMPGTPNPSGIPESFMDTPVVNGVAYPTITVNPKPYRFRILSIGNDRYWNLSLWVAADKTTPTTAGRSGAMLCTDNAVISPANCTEVKMVPFNSVRNASHPFPSWWYDATTPFSLDDRAGGVPDPDTRGPAMIQIATEGGFLPMPAVIKNQPVNYDYNRRSITVLNVLQHALFLGPAERADVIIDFKKFAGKTLILYNDSPAPVPASDPRLDYYTGDPDQTATGGAPSTVPGYGPNTRTVMQIVVKGKSSGPTIANDDVNTTILKKLQNTTTGLPAAFAASQEPIIVPQAAYNPVYGTTIVDTPGVNLVRIQDTSMRFAPFTQTTPVTMDLYPKSIIEDFQMDYGRMNAILGIEIPHTNITNQTSILQNLADPPTEVIKISDPTMTPIGSMADGTQIWKITHNGVDTHAIHFHMFNVQIVNRVGWDGAIKPPEANELGFKDTVRMNPLEDIILALRPIVLTNVPFKIPNSIRPLAPEAPIGATIGPTGMPLFQDVNPNGNPVTVTNVMVNLGWEFIWHCHLLGHEENDMMRPMALTVAPDTAPSKLVAIGSPVPGGLPNVILTWKDRSANETEWTIQKFIGTGPWATIATVQSATGPASGGTVLYIDSSVARNATYKYRVRASNTVGSTVPGYPQLTADSAPSNVVRVGPPAPPSNVVASQPVTVTPVVIQWTDNAPNLPNPPNFNSESSFIVQRATSSTGPWTTIATVAAAPGSGTIVRYSDNSATSQTIFYYRVRANNIFGSSSFVVSNPITTR